MSQRLKLYVSEVMAGIDADPVTKRRIAEDLLTTLNERSERSSVGRVLAESGAPGEMARDYMDGLYGIGAGPGSDGNQFPDDDLGIDSGDYYEYKSSLTVLDLPLVHIKLRRRGWFFGGAPAVAKGIIAIGDVALGAFAVGGIAAGGISIGGLSAGVLALGGAAAGAVATGGAAVGLLAVGGVAVGKIALGGLAIGKIAIGGSVIGKYTLSAADPGGFSLEQFRRLLEEAFPGVARWLRSFKS
ncbi:hypothetical protein SAMN04487895_103206 [Paenibacillus sophorae]|uniref:Uncharacterized protein n=1 Tax=Paenibacillus sophorae TaxID=1333845 RepID=A0A1H8K063_9BACL|nr:hypothetical protein [Paenibacillus sophorae]QWU13535.1 hypothetical protein KP014_16195 [Paenibacillus sophorae]SEN85896.1 hypothetical protein SAMN04487895_103206 [Paenibacillus sophorae]